MNYLITYQFDQPIQGVAMQNVPLHMTLMHWFAYDGPKERIVEVLQDIKLDTITVAANEYDMYGVDSDIPVTTMIKTPELQQLHSSIKAIIDELNVVHSQPQFVGESYGPHSTHKPDKKIEPGEAFMVDHLWLFSSEATGSSSPRLPLIKIPFDQ